MVVNIYIEWSEWVQNKLVHRKHLPPYQGAQYSLTMYDHVRSWGGEIIRLLSSGFSADPNSEIQNINRGRQKMVIQKVHNQYNRKDETTGQ